MNVSINAKDRARYEVNIVRIPRMTKDIPSERVATCGVFVPKEQRTIRAKIE